PRAKAPTTRLSAPRSPLPVAARPLPPGPPPGNLLPPRAPLPRPARLHGHSRLPSPRRSSGLVPLGGSSRRRCGGQRRDRSPHRWVAPRNIGTVPYSDDHGRDAEQLDDGPLGRNRPPGVSPGSGPRSEEHTSELQSRENLVCRLLLEKKNM